MRNRKIFIPEHMPLWISPEEDQLIRIEALKSVAIVTVFSIIIFAAEWIYTGIMS